MGTVMHETRVSLAKWFWAPFLTGYDKWGISAAHPKQKLRISYPRTRLMLRKAMGDRDEAYQLAGSAETDGTHIGGRRKAGRTGPEYGKVRISGGGIE
jgi:hypothetical protein